MQQVSVIEHQRRVIQELALILVQLGFDAKEILAIVEPNADGPRAGGRFRWRDVLLDLLTP